MPGWDNVSFMPMLFVPYLSPPDVVCLVLTSCASAKTFDTADTWRAVTKTLFAPVPGPKGHLSRRQRRKKGVWRAGDGAKARLSILWLQRTRDDIARLQNAHLLQQREHERRWVLQQAAVVMRACPYTSRQGRGCAHARLRLWSSANMVANKSSFRRQERPASHHGVRCSRCQVGPIVGSCYRCAAGCVAKRLIAKRFNSKQPLEGRCLPGLEKGEGGERSRHYSSGSRSPGIGKEGRERSSQSFGGSRSPSVGGGRGETARSFPAKAVMHISGGDEGCYTLCEACFSERGRFHPPHPFARLRPGFGESRLSEPELYEAVCGDCSFGSLLLVRPLMAHEVAGGSGGSGGSYRDDSADGDGGLWAVPVKVEAAGPLLLSQVNSRIAAGDRDDNRGLAFVSENWSLGNTSFDS